MIFPTAYINWQFVRLAGGGDFETIPVQAGIFSYHRIRGYAATYLVMVFDLIVNDICLRFIKNHDD